MYEKLNKRNKIRRAIQFSIVLIVAITHLCLALLPYYYSHQKQECLDKNIQAANYIYTYDSGICYAALKGVDTND